MNVYYHPQSVNYAQTLTLTYTPANSIQQHLSAIYDEWAKGVPTSFDKECMTTQEQAFQRCLRAQQTGCTARAERMRDISDAINATAAPTDKDGK